MAGPSIDRANSSGDIWTIPGYPNYYVSRSGEVFSSNRRWKLGTLRRLRTEKDKDGYLFVYLTIQGKRYRPKVHQLVALTFLGERPSPRHEVRHLDGSRQNNYYKNLAWGTRKDNADDRERHGRTAKGPAIARALFTVNQVREIRRRIANGERAIDIARDLKVHRQHISNLRNGRTYSSVV